MKLIININEEELTEDELEEVKRIADDCFSGVKTIIPDNATNEIETIIRRYTDEQTN